MNKIIYFVYGVIAYALFLATFLYAIGFIGNVVVPKSMDSGPVVPLAQALLINAALLTLFAIQHSLMARPAFKKIWTRIIPEPIERSTYVLLSSLALILLFWLWQPMGGAIWNIADPVARSFVQILYGMGWLIVLISTFMINHFDLFGLRQVYVHLQGQPYTPLAFRVPGPYRYVRHPLYVGWLVVFWATPTMTFAHLFFALATTAYILIAIQWEERDLMAYHGDAYKKYRQQVPMLLPMPTMRSQMR